MLLVSRQVHAEYCGLAIASAPEVVVEVMDFEFDGVAGWLDELSENEVVRLFEGQKLRIVLDWSPVLPWTVLTKDGGRVRRWLRKWELRKKTYMDLELDYEVRAGSPLLEEDSYSFMNGYLEGNRKIIWDTKGEKGALDECEKLRQDFAKFYKKSTIRFGCPSVKILGDEFGVMLRPARKS